MAQKHPPDGGRPRRTTGQPQALPGFDLYAVRKWPATKVAKEMGVSVLQVYLIYHRLTRQVRKEVEYLESKLD